MRLTRRRFLGGAAAAALGGAGIYELVDQLTAVADAPGRRADALPPEQHVFDLGIVESEGVEVLVPPLHSEVVTATLDGRRPARGAARPRAGAARPRRALPARTRPGSASRSPGACRTSSGTSRRRRSPISRSTAARASPRCCRRAASRATRTTTLLEENDVAVLLRSDSREHIDDARKALFDDLPHLPVTSIRRGFAGGGFDGKQSLPKKMAMAAGVARRRPDPRHVRALPRLHVDAEGGPRPAADREPRDARLRRPARRLLPRRHAHAPLAPQRGPRGVVPQLRLRRACAHDVPSRADGREAGSADGAAGAEGRRDAARSATRQFEQTGRFGHSASIQTTSRLRRTSSAPTAPSTRRARRSRSAPTSTRSTTRSRGPRSRSATS